MAGRFRSRPTNHTGVVDHDDWRIKWYEITLNGEPIDPAIVEAARRLADEVCGGSGAAVSDPAANSTPDPTGVGFGIIHHGAESVWVLLDRWYGDIVAQHTWAADLDDPDRFTVVPPGGPTACVWELAVHGHERRAFIEHVLDPVDGPNFDAYLADVPSGSTVDRHLGRRDTLEAFARAWAAGDVDALMTLMSDDPVYRPSAVAEFGFEYRGRNQVREGFAAVIAAEQSMPVVGGATYPVELLGDRAISRWSYADVEGVDLWTFDGDRLAIKDAYRRIRSADPS